MDALSAAAGTEQADPDRCCICLSPFEKQAVASVEKCQHVFCLTCILLWSQTSNTCPVDRITFSFIYQRRCPGGEVKKKMKVSTPKKDEEDEEEAGDAVICEECGRSDRRHRLLVCIHCDSGYHMDCLTPSINTGSDGDWICHDCVGDGHHTDTSMVEEVISDTELTDLLAEANETAPASTSTRLRPSTLTRASSSTERRRSARAQRTSSNNLHPQTSWHVPRYLLGASRPAATTDEQAANHHSDSSNMKRLKQRRI